MAISGVFLLFTNRPDNWANTKTAQILQRLPAHLRGNLISISVEDHYVEVTTNKGKHLVLIRFSDAMGETNGVAGLQIHRSHWVAFEGIEKVRRRDGKVFVETKTGATLPASRTYLAQMKEAGWLS